MWNNEIQNLINIQILIFKFQKKKKFLLMKICQKLDQNFNQKLKILYIIWLLNISIIFHQNIKFYSNFNFVFSE